MRRQGADGLIAKGKQGRDRPFVSFGSAIAGGDFYTQTTDQTKNKETHDMKKADNNKASKEKNTPPPPPSLRAIARMMNCSRDLVTSIRDNNKLPDAQPYFWELFCLKPLEG